MKNIHLGAIIENRKDELKKLGYDTSNENMEHIVNGFIKIFNSIIIEDTEKMENMELTDILILNIYKNVFKIKKFDFIKFNENSSIKIVEEESIEFEIINTYKAFIDGNGIKDIIKNMNKDFLYLELLKYLKDENNLLFSNKKNIKDIVQILKEKSHILELFNKGELNKVQEEILIELGYKFNLK